jgi:soluble lytic murein transglycosylase-like protein
LKITVKKLTVSLLVFLLSTNTIQASYDRLAKLAGISAYKMEKIIQKLVKVETSTGKYDVLNHRSGTYGRYQIMPSAAEWYAKKLAIPIDSWKTPKNQDKIFKAILKDQHYKS